MDPPIISESSFSAANPSSYTLSEIWPFQINTAGGLGSGLAANRERSVPVVDESTVTDQSGGGARKRRYFSSEDESSKIVSTTTSGANDLNGSNGRKMKLSGGKIENGSSKPEAEATSAGGSKSAEPNAKPEPPKDYIHVRARRGQATDSHSLAERARREKISERMKILQDLVPGCNKVIGKAIVLDEIINYIQSLQRQVEFLSMKLEAVNSRVTINPPVEDFHSKDPFDASHTMFPPRAAAAEYVQGSQSEWLHMQVGGSYERPS